MTDIPLTEELGIGGTAYEMADGIYEKNRRRGKFLRNLASVMMILYFWLMVLSVPCFFIGFHNADLAANIRWINAEYRLDLQEMFPEMTPEAQYSQGMAMMLGSFMIGIISTGCFFIMTATVDALDKKWGFNDE